MVGHHFGAVRQISIPLPAHPPYKLASVPGIRARQPSAMTTPRSLSDFAQAVLIARGCDIARTSRPHNFSHLSVS